MARTRLPDPCLICDEVNCRCGKAPKPEKVVRKRSPKKAQPAAPAPDPEPVQQVASEPHPLDAPPAPKASARAAMKARAARSRTPAPVAPTPAPVVQVKQVPTSAEPDVMQDAIRALEPILAYEEKVTHAKVLARTTSSDRAAAWRERRASVHTQ
jgi:hypothetical protein